MCFSIESAPSEEEHNIQEIKMTSSVGVHENIIKLLRTCLSELSHVLVNSSINKYNLLFYYGLVYLIMEYFAHSDLLGFLCA